MAPLVKFLIGLAAALLMGWIHFGPLGNGEALVESLERQAAEAVARAELPGIDVSLGRDPLTRVATLSGEANQFQREGKGSLPGLNNVVGEIEGIARVQWTDQDPSAGTPLIGETLLLVAGAYLIGILLAWLIWARKRPEGYA